MTTEKDPEEFTDEEVHEARKNLNPIEDVKGAVRFIKEMDPIEEVKEFMERAVEVLDPRQSDVRVVVPEEDEAADTDPEAEDLDG